MTDARLLADDARRLLEELDRDLPAAAQSSGECRPALDIVETTDATEVVVDLPGITHAALRVAIRRDTVLILQSGLLRIILPRIDDRRGRLIHIDIETA